MPLRKEVGLHKEYLRDKADEKASSNKCYKMPLLTDQSVAALIGGD